jgi:type I restriction enzyme S subunit
MAAVEKAKKAAEERLEAAKALPAAYLREKLRSKSDTLPSKWQVRTFGNVLRLKHGYAFKSSFFSDEGEYVVLTPGHFFEKGGFRANSDKQKRYDGEIPEGFVLVKDDIVVVMTQQAPGLLGSSALIPQDDLYLHNQRLGKVVDLDETVVDHKFLFHLFNASYVREQIEITATGSMVQHTSPIRIYDVSIVLPPLDEQKKIVSELDGKRTAILQTEASVQQELVTIEAMPAALLRKAFSGEL